MQNSWSKLKRTIHESLSAYHSRPILFRKRDGKILRSRNGGESGGNGAFGMKTIMRFYTRVAPEPTVSVQPTDSQQRPTTRVAPARTVQDKNQNQTNSDSSAVAASHQDRHERHDREWWKQHFLAIVFVLGGYYYWDGGYWYPALGYDPEFLLRPRRPDLLLWQPAARPDHHKCADCVTATGVLLWPN
jgi:hypothetical protein